MTGFDPIAAALARRATSDLARSALPDAPVVAEPSPRRPRSGRGRALVAAALRRVARAVEPAPRCGPAH